MIIRLLWNIQSILLIKRVTLCTFSAWKMPRRLMKCVIENFRRPIWIFEVKNILNLLHSNLVSAKLLHANLQRTCVFRASWPEASKIHRLNNLITWVFWWCQRYQWYHSFPRLLHETHSLISCIVLLMSRETLSHLVRLLLQIFVFVVDIFLNGELRSEHRFFELVLATFIKKNAVLNTSSVLLFSSLT